MAFMTFHIGRIIPTDSYFYIFFKMVKTVGNRFPAYLPHGHM